MARTVEQRRSDLDRTRCAIARLGHDLRRQRIEEQRDVGGVVGERRDGERVARIGDQAGRPTVAFTQQFGQFRSCLQQARWRQVTGKRRLRHVHRNHHRRAAMHQRMFDGAPARPGQRKYRQHPRHALQRQHGSAMACDAALGKVRKQVRIDRFAPGVFAPAAPMPCKHDQRQRQQGPEPCRTQQMEVREQAGHARKPRDAPQAAIPFHRSGTIASNALNSAKASSHG